MGYSSEESLKTLPVKAIVSASKLLGQFRASHRLAVSSRPSKLPPIYLGWLRKGRPRRPAVRGGGAGAATAQRGAARHGTARHGSAWLGRARLGSAGQDTALHAQLSSALHTTARLSAALHGWARRKHWRGPGRPRRGRTREAGTGAATAAPAAGGSAGAQPGGRGGAGARPTQAAQHRPREPLRPALLPRAAGRQVGAGPGTALLRFRGAGRGQPSREQSPARAGRARRSRGTVLPLPDLGDVIEV